MAYQKQEWSLKTPITPDALNHIEEGISNIDDNLYFKPGDTYEITRYIVNGFISSGRSSLYVTLHLPKSLEKINSITCELENVEIRGTNGYIYPSKGTLSRNWNTSDFTGLVFDNIKDNHCQFRLNQEGQYYYSNGSLVTNNIPISINFATLKMTFN